MDHKQGLFTMRLRLALCALSLLVARGVGADTTPTGFQDYYLIGHSEQLYDMLEYIRTQEGATFGSPLGVNAVTTLTATTDIQMVIWDHWEDGYEADPLHPTDATTLVLGDGNAANGNADDFCDASLGGDTVNLDTVLAWKSRGDTAPAAINRYIPYPRTVPIPQPVDLDDLRFDAPDRVVVVGGPVNLVHSMEPRSQYIGGAMSIYPRQLMSSTTDYTIPIGENLDDDNHFDPFDYVFLQLQSYADATNVTIDNPVAGTAISFQLAEGASWSSRGMLNHDASDRANLQITIDAGTRVSADGPVTALLVTGGTGTFQTRFYSLLPEQLFGTDYLTPVYGSAQTSEAGPQNLYLFNPHGSELAITAYDTGGTRTLTVPAESVRAYSQVVPGGVPVGSTVRLVADRHFWGVAAMDYGGPYTDWGYGLVPTNLLTSAIGMSWAPGDRFEPPASNGAPVFVSPLMDNTIIRVDNDDDPTTWEHVDINGDGWADPFTATNGYEVDTLESLRLFDAGDNDQTGMRIFGTNRFVAAYGQDPAMGGTADFLDLGYEVMPQDESFIDEVLSVRMIPVPRTITASDPTVQITLQVRTASSGPVTGIDAGHLLPSYFSYVADSARVDYPDGSFLDPANPIETSLSGGRTSLFWDLDATMEAGELLEVTFSAIIDTGSAPEDRYNHTAEADGTFEGRRYVPRDTVPVVYSGLELTLAVDVSTARPGDTITYTATLRNAATSTYTNIDLSIPVPFDTSLTSAGTGTYEGACHCVRFADIDLAAGASVTPEIQVTVSADAPPDASITNEARAEPGTPPPTPTSFPEIISGSVATEVRVPRLIPVLSAPAVTATAWPYMYTLRVDNTGNEPATDLVITTDVPDDTAYEDGSIEISYNGGSYTTLTDSADADEGQLIAGSPDQVRIDLATLAAGDWLRVRFQVAATASSGTITASALTDAVELLSAAISNSVETTIDNSSDPDGDGLVSGDFSDPDPCSTDPDTEACVGTDPFDGDSDDDGLLDGDEHLGTGPLTGFDPTDPNDWDSDDDLLADGTEVGVFVRPDDTDLAAGHFRSDADNGATTTDPNDADSDDDQLEDGAEDVNFDGAVDLGVETDPNNPDTDGDTVYDGPDNCPLTSNTSQEDFDNDGVGDACDPDKDNDGSSAAEDCDDLDGASYPGATEVCDGNDNDCNGVVPADEGDDDSDSYVECSGWSDTQGDNPGIAGGDDCDDEDATSYPGATEACDGNDNVCAGAIAGNEIDDDGDLWVECSGWSDTQGDNGTILGGDDCLDSNGFVNPGATEVCDGFDTDCSSGSSAADEASEMDDDSDGYVECSGYTDHGATLSGGDDCDDEDATSSPGATEVCDGNDNDCDGVVPAEEGDDDSDSYVECSGWSDPQGDNPGIAGGDDCDDEDATSYPGGTEACDGNDNDCDGVVPAEEGDDDGDFYVECSGWSDPQADNSTILGGDDCLDSNGFVNPGADEVCDGFDTDCSSGSAAADDASEVDDDADGYIECSDYTDHGATLTGGDDCDDSDVVSYPGAAELCDGNDNACAGAVGAGEIDNDLDSYVECTGWVDLQGDDPGIAGGGDCDDNDATTYVGASEQCDGNDNGCAGAVAGNELDADGDFYVECTGWSDPQGDDADILGGDDCLDSNGFVNPGATEECDGFDTDCSSGSSAADDASEVDDDADGYIACSGYTDHGAGLSGGDDCDDLDAASYPGAAEACDGNDNDCDSVVSAGELDSDGDTYVACHPWSDTQGDQPQVYAGGDCAEGNAAVHPGATEIECNGINDDCDFDTPDDPDSTDGDRDGFTVDCGNDCDDDNYFIHPEAAEHCTDELDNNCDGLVDGEDTSSCSAQCEDSDEDGFYDADCGGSDCRDDDPQIHPNAAENCGDGIDNDCDGFADSADSQCPPGCDDSDDDGYPAATCGGSDCDDSRIDVSPGVVEICGDLVDNDCDGMIDDLDALDCPAGCDDTDSDGHRDAACGGNDCNDVNGSVHPGAGENCDDGIDNNCDGDVDGDDALCPADCVDSDDDGYPDRDCGGSDCDDTNGAIYPSAGEDCTDAIDNDCDGLEDELDLIDCPAGCSDADGDGFYDRACGGNDCDDTEYFINPGLREVCDNGVDDDCDGAIDYLDSGDCDEDCFDADGDADGHLAEACGGNDCDDTNPAVNPNAAEHCSDGVDNDCDGDVDGDDVAECPAGCSDADGDGFPDLACGGSDCDDDEETVNPGAAEVDCDGVDNDCNGLTSDLPDQDTDGYVAESCAPGEDCDDGNPLIHPDAGESCVDTIDNNCDGLTDDDDPLCDPTCGDGDLDGYPDESCGGSDCDDADPNRHPGAGEQCSDGLDNDCDDLVDEADAIDCPPGCLDLDGDGYRAASCGGTDCDDGRFDIHPGGGERCDDGLDNDCNGLVDAADAACDTACPDADGDGYRDAACGGSDCDDTTESVHPGAGEDCTDGDDNNCDARVDGQDPFCPGDCGDGDGDGYADHSCGGSDCDDSAGEVHPGTWEICDDGLDNDCNGAVDQLDGDCPAGCADTDSDGFAAEECGGRDCNDLLDSVNPGVLEILCNGVDDDCAPASGDDPAPEDADGDGYTAGCGNDCDETNPWIHEGAPERCDDGTDNDCDGSIDGLDSECPAGCADLDGDGFLAIDCGGSDCDDANYLINPGAGEHCADQVDNDCDGNVDGADPQCEASCADRDGDGYSDIECGGSDCDDSDFSIHPGGGEHCTDGFDNNCNGLADWEDGGDCPPSCGDLDGDGYTDRACGGSDCSDMEAGAYPGSAEVCDGADNDCDGRVDEGYPNQDGDELADCVDDDDDGDGWDDRVSLSGGGYYCGGAGGGLWALTALVLLLRRRPRRKPRERA